MASDSRKDRRGQAPPLRVPDGIRWGAPESPAPEPAQVRLSPVPPGPRAATPAGVPPERPVFTPRQPRTWVKAGLDVGQVSDLVLRFLGSGARMPSKRIADGIALALPLMREITHRLKDAKLVAYVGTNVVGDFSAASPTRCTWAIPTSTNSPTSSRPWPTRWACACRTARPST